MVPSELAELLAKSDVLCERAKVLFAVFRMTLGYRGQKTDRIALTQLAKLTGLKPQNVSRGLMGLVNAGFVTKTGTPHKIQTIGFDYLDNQTGESRQSKLINTKDSSSKNISSTEGGLENDLRTKIEKWLKSQGRGNPTAYLDSLINKCNKNSKAVTKAWNDMKRGSCEPTPGDFFERAVYYAGHIQKHLP